MNDIHDDIFMEREVCAGREQIEGRSKDDPFVGLWHESGDRFLPCRFCGGAASIEQNKHGVIELGCDNIGCGVMPSATHLSVEDAADNWNCRTNISNALGVDSNIEPFAYAHPSGMIWRLDNYPAGVDFAKDGWFALYRYHAPKQEK